MDNEYFLKETSSTLHAFINFGSADAAHICVTTWHDHRVYCVCIKLFIAYHAVKGQGRRHVDIAYPLLFLVGLEDVMVDGILCSIQILVLYEW